MAYFLWVFSVCIFDSIHMWVIIKNTPLVESWQLRQSLLSNKNKNTFEFESNSLSLKYLKIEILSPL